MAFVSASNLISNIIKAYLHYNETHFQRLAPCHTSLVIPGFVNASAGHGGVVVESWL